tara:strand:+ start:56 stop:1108 length:1053 start_codon:yes stop_codon:yes gene_type:complete
MKLISLFSGCGGLDLGFKKAGFKFVWANEFNKSIVPTFKKNFPRVELDTRSITKIDPEETPSCDGIIGGPPCQSWSAFGTKKGIDDPRGKLFYDYIRFIDIKRPKFFLAENVPGLLFRRHSESLKNIFNEFLNLGYNVSFQILNANDYGVPQNRKRVIIVGYPSSFKSFFSAPKPIEPKKVTRDFIFHLKDNAVSALEKNKPNLKTKIDNHEYFIGNFSSHYLSRNRVLDWDKPSFTIQASGRHAPCHPSSPKMIKVKKDVCKFSGSRKPRRLTIRECAALQTFPNDFKFLYSNLNDGYKMIGNAVPVNFSKELAEKIKKDLKKFDNLPVDFSKKGRLINLDFKQLSLEI